MICSMFRPRKVRCGNSVLLLAILTGIAAVLTSGDLWVTSAAAADPALFLPLVMAGPKTGVIYGELLHNELLREYILYVPSSYDGRSAAPLIVNYHAYARDAQTQMAYADFRAIAERSGAIIAHPQGVELDGARLWNVGGLYANPQADDVGFTAALIDEIARIYNVDTNRIYSTGFSNGGYMSYLVACQLGDRIAAVAPVSGSMTPEMAAACNPARPLAILHIHGLDDGIVPFGGDVVSLPVEDVLEYWIAVNGNDPTPVVEQYPDLDPSDGSTVEGLLYGAGPTGVTIELLKISGGGHTWPGAAVWLPGTNYDIDASEQIWNFFAKYDINGPVDSG